ncbi:MAG: hypothetical protein WC788_01325 [Candidatus Paceibacterota bacterium]|jgi:hypothetical protein
MSLESEQFEKMARQAVMSEKGYEKLKEGIPGFWSGRDIPMREKQLVEPKSLIFSEVILTKENFPPVEADWGVLRRLSLSTRSRLAQSGIEIRIDYDRVTQDDIERINKGEEVPFPVMIENHGDRAIEFEGEATRFFWTNEKNRLRGKELRDAVLSDIKIEGEEGKDWFIAGADYDSENDELIQLNMKNEKFRESMKDIMIVFPMKKKLHIPKDDKPLNIGSRKDLEDALKPVPEEDDSDFYLGETPRVELGENVCGVINTGSYDGGKRHLISPLIDPGFKGKIRTELLDNLGYIELFIFKR